MYSCVCTHGVDSRSTAVQLCVHAGVYTTGTAVRVYICVYSVYTHTLSNLSTTKFCTTSTKFSTTRVYTAVNLNLVSNII